MGLDTALSEITLVLFTTLAPTGVLAFLIMSLPLLFHDTNAEIRTRIGKMLCIPLVAAMVGLISSATHLGNPSNALYVFTGVGRSPLSNEVFCAVIFLALAGVYWLYQFKVHQNEVLRKIWLVLIILAGLACITAIAFAYDASTILTWHTAYVPISIWLNALLGGPILALVGLSAAHHSAVSKRFIRNCLIASSLALIANIVCYLFQGSALSTMANSFRSAFELVPFYYLMLAGFAILCIIGLFLCVHHLKAHGVIPLKLLIVTSVFILVGIFIMRFAFYMMHMTVGLGI